MWEIPRRSPGALESNGPATVLIVRTGRKSPNDPSRPTLTLWQYLFIENEGENNK